MNAYAPPRRTVCTFTAHFALGLLLLLDLPLRTVRIYSMVPSRFLSRLLRRLPRTGFTPAAARTGSRHSSHAAYSVLTARRRCAITPLLHYVPLPAADLTVCHSLTTTRAFFFFFFCFCAQRRRILRTPRHICSRWRTARSASLPRHLRDTCLPSSRPLASAGLFLAQHAVFATCTAHAVRGSLPYNAHTLRVFLLRLPRTRHARGSAVPHTAALHHSSAPPLLVRWLRTRCDSGRVFAFFSCELVAALQVPRVLRHAAYRHRALYTGCASLLPLRIHNRCAHATHAHSSRAPAHAQCCLVAGFHVSAHATSSRFSPSAPRAHLYATTGLRCTCLHLFASHWFARLLTPRTGFAWYALRRARWTNSLRFAPFAPFVRTAPVTGPPPAHHRLPPLPFLTFYSPYRTHTTGSLYTWFALLTS